LKKFYLLGAKSCYNGKRCKGLKKKKEFLVMANKGKILFKSLEKKTSKGIPAFFRPKMWERAIYNHEAPLG